LVLAVSTLFPCFCHKKQGKFKPQRTQRPQRAQRNQKEILFSVFSVLSVVGEYDFLVAGIASASHYRLVPYFPVSVIKKQGKFKPQRTQRAQRNQKEILSSVSSVLSVVGEYDFLVAGIASASHYRLVFGQICLTSRLCR